MKNSIRSARKETIQKKFMRRFFFYLLTIGIALPIAGCVVKKNTSKDSKPIIETLVRASESWNGDIYSYPQGQAQMTLLKITPSVGFRTPFHLIHNLVLLMLLKERFIVS